MFFLLSLSACFSLTAEEDLIEIHLEEDVEVEVDHRNHVVKEVVEGGVILLENGYFFCYLGDDEIIEKLHPGTPLYIGVVYQEPLFRLIAYPQRHLQVSYYVEIPGETKDLLLKIEQIQCDSTVTHLVLSDGSSWKEVSGLPATHHWKEGERVLFSRDPIFNGNPQLINVDLSPEIEGRDYRIARVKEMNE